MDKSQNLVVLRGTVKTQPELFYEIFGKKFLRMEISSLRKSGTSDIIPVIISEKILPEEITINSYIELSGRVQTFNKKDEKANKNRTIVSVFAEEIIDCGTQIDSIFDDLDDLNEVDFVGYICKEPTYRVTPGGREVSDLTIAVNRKYGKSYYIPCVLWGRSARWSKTFSIGDCISLHGRFQSREYVKRIDGIQKTMTAYEISALQVDIL